MKRTIIKVIGNKDGYWCSQNGNALEIMAAHLTALQGTIDSLEQSQDKRCQQFLEMLREDIEELFDEHGIKGKGIKTKDND